MTWENWRNWDEQNDPGFPTSEAILYSDAHVTGELTEQDWPYQFMTTISGDGPGVKPAIAVRQWWSADDTAPDMTVTRADTYHGGSSLEELASLLSCGLGFRCRAGGLTRSWRWTDDPLGRPFDFDSVVPYLPAASLRGPVLPELTKVTINLGAMEPLLRRYRAMSASAAAAVVRAARMYQQAIWVAEDSPHLAWLYLVGAAEVAALNWRGGIVAPAAILVDADPELASLLAGSDGLLDKVAERTAHLFKSQARFLGWMEEFKTPPPDEALRPPEWGRVDWATLRSAFVKVYTHRSAALHDGRPFPQPMCDPPTNPHAGPPLEVPFALANAYNDSTWTRDETPMYLRTFEYLVRGALLGWWRTIPSSDAQGGAQQTGDS